MKLLEKLVFLISFIIGIGIYMIPIWIIDGLFFDPCVFRFNSYDKDECYRRKSIDERTRERYYDQQEGSLFRDGY